jgi:hypothetical protein
MMDKELKWQAVDVINGGCDAKCDFGVYRVRYLSRLNWQFVLYHKNDTHAFFQKGLPTEQMAKTWAEIDYAARRDQAIINKVDVKSAETT